MKARDAWKMTVITLKIIIEIIIELKMRKEMMI